MPTAGGRQCLLEVPSRLECRSGIALSQRSVLLECLGGGSEHVGMSPCSPEHQVSSWVCLPQGQGPDCTAVLICAVNVFGLVFVVTEFPLQIEEVFDFRAKDRWENLFELPLSELLNLS